MNCFFRFQGCWIVFCLALWLPLEFRAQSGEPLRDTLTPQLLISACAEYREEILDEMVSTIIAFNLLCDSLKSVSACPEAYEKFRHAFFNEAIILDEYSPADMVDASMPAKIYYEKGHGRIVRRWVESHFWPIVQMLFLRSHGLIEDQSPYRLAGVRQFWDEISFYQLTRGDLIVDVGAGTGTISFVLAKTGLVDTAYLTEVDKKMLFYIRGKIATDQSAETTKLFALDGAEDHLGLPPEVKADIIFMREVFHHIKAKDKILLSVGNHLKPGGKLVLIESTIESETNKKTRCPKAIHNSEIEDWLNKSGFVIESMRQSDDSMLYRAYPKL